MDDTIYNREESNRVERTPYTRLSMWKDKFGIFDSIATKLLAVNRGEVNGWEEPIVWRVTYCCLKAAVVVQPDKEGSYNEVAECSEESILEGH